MRFFEKIKKKHEERILKKEQARQAEIERKQAEIEKILNSPIPKSFIIRLRHDVKDTKGNDKYTLWDYFLCDKRISDLDCGDRCKAIKVSGSHLGEKFNLSLTSLTSRTKCELYINGEYWSGNTRESLSFLSEFHTIADLNNYETEYNEIRKEEYETSALRKQQEEEQIQNQFFK